MTKRKGYTSRWIDVLVCVGNGGTLKYIIRAAKYRTNKLIHLETYLKGRVKALNMISQTHAYHKNNTLTTASYITHHFTSMAWNKIPQIQKSGVLCSTLYYTT